MGKIMRANATGIATAPRAGVVLRPNRPPESLHKMVPATEHVGVEELWLSEFDIQTIKDIKRFVNMATLRPEALPHCFNSGATSSTTLMSGSANYRAPRRTSHLKGFRP